MKWFIPENFKFHQLFNGEVNDMPQAAFGDSMSLWVIYPVNETPCILQSTLLASTSQLQLRMKQHEFQHAKVEKLWIVDGTLA